MRIDPAVPAVVQGLYFLVTGLWSFLAYGLFERVTGPKTDDWLVKTVGALVSVIGMVLLWAARPPRRPTPEVVGLGAGSGIALAIVDIVYVTRGRISRVYLADAAAELVLATGWVLAWLTSRRSTTR